MLMFHRNAPWLMESNQTPEVVQRKRIGGRFPATSEAESFIRKTAALLADG